MTGQAPPRRCVCLSISQIVPVKTAPTGQRLGTVLHLERPLVGCVIAWWSPTQLRWVVGAVVGLWTSAAVPIGASDTTNALLPNRPRSVCGARQLAQLASGTPSPCRYQLPWD